MMGSPYVGRARGQPGTPALPQTAQALSASGCDGNPAEDCVATVCIEMLSPLPHHIHVEPIGSPAVRNISREAVLNSFANLGFRVKAKGAGDGHRPALKRDRTVCQAMPKNGTSMPAQTASPAIPWSGQATGTMSPGSRAHARCLPGWKSAAKVCSASRLTVKLKVSAPVTRRLIAGLWQAVTTGFIPA